MSKKTHIWGIVFLVVLADQLLKYYVKTGFLLGDHISVFGDWFQLYFVENPGMAYGWKFGGNWGKVVLTVFRLCAVVFGVFYLNKIINKPEKYHKGFVLCAAFIFAGALGNLIDSCFYGLLFDKGMVYNPSYNEYLGYEGLATINGKGYASFLHGNVVDMLYFPVLRGSFPDWVPGWGGQEFEFFRPVFNIADAAISLGVITLVLFQRKFFPESNQDESTSEEKTVDLQ